MRKKDHPTANNQHLSNKEFVIAAAFKHFERDRIDSAVLGNFNSLVHSITLRLLRSNNEPEAIELFKITNELIIGFTANLSEETYRHSCTSEDIIQLFVVVANYFEKSTTTFGNCDIIIQSNLINIFWPLFEKPVESPKSIEPGKVELINNMIQNIEEYKRDNLCLMAVVKQTFAAANFGHKKGQSLVREYLVAFLRSVASVSNLKSILLKYLTTVISENHEQNFRKALKIYEHMGVSFEDRRENLQDLLFKTLDFNNCIPFVMDINESFSLSKLVKTENLPYVILRMVEKIFTKNNVSVSCLRVLQELSSMSITDFSKMDLQKVGSKGQNLVIRFLEWIIVRYSKKEQLESMQAQALELKEKMMEEAEFKEEKLIEFVKKLSHKNSEGNEAQKNNQLTAICSHFSKFVKNISRYPVFYERICIKDIDSITTFKNNDKILSNPIVKEFICSIFPTLIQQFTINPKDKLPLKYAIMLRKVELQAEKCSRQSRSLESLFKQAFFQMIQTESLNYHFALCFILLKYEKQRDSMRDVIVDSIVADLKKQGTNKNSRNLLLNLSLILKSYDHLCLSQPLRFKIKQVIKNSDLLANKLEINHLIGVQPKEYTNLKHNNAKFQPKIEEMKYLLNRELANYSNKQHLNLIYSLTIAVNDLIQTPETNASENTLLTQITQLRRQAILGQLYTNIHLINESIDIISTSQQFSHPKKIEVFLLLLKIKYLTKNSPIKENEDSELLFQKLQVFMLHINTNLNHDLFSQLQNLKSNPSLYSSQPFQNYLEQKQIIKFYAEATKDIYQTHVVLSKVSQTIFQKLMEMKKITYNDLSEELKNLSLLYSTIQDLKAYGFTSQQEQQLVTYIMVLLLNQKIRQGLPFEILLKKIFLNAAHLPELFLQKHSTNVFKSFMSGYPVDFTAICVTAVKKALVSEQKDDLALFELVRVAIDQDNKNCNCFQKTIMQKLRTSFEGNICELIFQRAKKGIQMESKTVYFKNSQLLYKLISKSIDINKNNLQQLVENLVQLDCYNSSDQSGFILKETSLIFAHLQEKSSEICQTIFNYILTLTDIFKGDQKLQISTFICSFFGLEISIHHQINYEHFEKKVNLACSNSPNYKCLKCDEKKIICYSCAVTCHQNHPVCFLNIPVQLKFAKCLCSDIGGNACKLYKENPKSNFFKPSKNDFAMIALSGQKPIGNPGINPPPEFFERMRVVGGNFVPRHPRDQLYEPPIPSDRQSIQTLLREQELLQQQMRSNQWYDTFRDRERDREKDRQRREDRQEFLPRMGGRLERIFDREQLQGGYKMFIEPNQIRKPKNIFNNIQKEKQESIAEVLEPQFIDENYQNINDEKAEDQSMQNEQGNTILKKYVLLPKFIDLMVSFCSKKSDKDKITTNFDQWKLSFASPQISKIIPALTFKLHNNANFSFEIRKENAIHNMSCVLIKKNIAQNAKFLLLASSTQIFVFSKQKILACVAEMKLASGYNSISRHSISFEVHSMEFSPVDPTLFCVSGLHNLSLMNINAEGHIARTSFRYNVSNFYINKIKIAKMGIFVGIDKEIRVLNFTCRHFLTIKAQESNTIIREWTIFQKAAGCQILFVCPNGNIFTLDVMPTDEGKKQFVSRVTDHRANKTGTGASIFAKDLPDFGKYLFASFKDGSNILGHLQSDQLEDMVNLQLKGIKFQKNIFDTNFIVGHADLVKLNQIDEVYLICTVKKYFPPELSFHQGFLIAVRFKKDGSSEIIILNDEVTCEYFQVVRVGKRNFFVYSVHTDGSIQISTPNKLTKANIQEELNYIKESQDLEGPAQNGDFGDSVENISAVRKLIEKQLKLDAISRQSNVPTCSFRQGSDILKSGTDYTLIKHSATEFQFKQTNFTKILTGFSVPYFGDVILPTRQLKNVFQIGLTQLQALYLFSQGSFRFKYIRNEEQKYTRESFFNPNAHPRMLERIERIERLSEYHDGEKLLNSHIMSTILGFKEDTNSELMFVGKTFELYRAKIPRFEQIFRVESDDENSSIEKTALIIKMFLTKSLKDGNPCGEQELLQLIEAIKTIVPSSSKRLFNLLRDIIVLAVTVYEKQSGKTFSVNDQNYALRAATENRVLHYFKILKLDISDGELNEFLNLLCQLVRSDEELMTYYVAKYSGIFIQLHRRLKKADNEQRAIALVQLYSFGYPILKFCEVPCSWMLGCICSTTYAFLGSKTVRERLFSSIQRSKRIVFQNWLKSLCNSDGIVEEVELANSGGREPLMDEPKDQMMEIYNMYNRGQIDEETLFKMISEASKLEYQREQENQMGGSDKNMQILPELEQEMQIESVGNNYNSALVIDLIDECTDNFSDSVDVTNSRVMVLYVLSRAIDECFEDCTSHILKRIKKMVNQIDLKSEGEKLNSILGFSCLFNRILINSGYLKQNGGKNNPLYLEIETEVNAKLTSIRLETVPKLKNPPNVLGKIFRGEKLTYNINIAYALICLLLFPCEPSHVLLSLQCYWLLPESKQFYSKQKDFSNITDGIESGNIQKVYQIAKNNPKIWQQYRKLQFVERWIEQKRHNWELALELIAIYYQD